MRINISIELRRPARRSVAIVLGLLLLAAPAAVLADHQFSDVPNTNQFHDDIDWLADYGITTGFDDGTYRPTNAVTRQAMAAFMRRLSSEFELVSTTVDPTASTTFSRAAVCPDGKRAIAGGGKTDAFNVFVANSYPQTPSIWVVNWETANDATLNPSSLTVYALCAPGL